MPDMKIEPESGGPTKTVSWRIPRVLYDVLEKRARCLKTTLTWVLESCVANFMRDELPPSYRIGMPHKDWPDKEEDND